MRKKKNILPCPCCKSKDIEYKEESAVRCFIRCSKCGIEIRGKYLKSIINKWNRREGGELDFIYLEGNKGGDFIKISKVEDNILRLESAHCCVYNFSHEMPVEVLTSLLSDLSLYFEDEDKLFKKLGWNKEYKDILINQVKKIDYFENKKPLKKNKYNRFEIMDI